MSCSIPTFRIFAVALLVSVGVAKAPAAEPVQVASVEGITEYRLANGFRFLLFPDNSKPLVTVNLTVLVGSRHEGYGETGMAHLLEHMLFKGTPTHPNVPKALRDHGARFNGTTWVDRTNYYETMPASDDNLEFGIELEADRLLNSSNSRSLRNSMVHKEVDIPGFVRATSDHLTSIIYKFLLIKELRL